MKRIPLIEKYICNAQWMRELYKDCSYNSFLCEDFLLDNKFDVGLSERVKLSLYDDSAWEVNEYGSFMESVSHFKGTKQLTPYTKDELAQRNIKTFKLKGYNIGFALKPTNTIGETHHRIVLIHNNEENIGGIGDSIFQLAVDKGGDVIPHYDGFLDELYERNGFSIKYLTMMFDDSFADAHWDYELYGRPPIIVRVLKKVVHSKQSTETYLT